MSQGFEIKSTSGKKSSPPQLPLREVAEIQDIQRQFWNKTTRDVQFYLTSLDSDAQLLGRAIRKHWGIENEAHWTLDCTFAEDACRIRSFHSPRNLAVLRRIALNALNCEPTYKRSLRQKMKRAAMDNDYLIQIISSCFLDKILDFSASFCQA
ncbi:hypothetical protein E5S67_04553 [Microcoleus sp. IPMA8]|uniref:Transposase IS4-like domain-containing protein n=2 Tax=Microcoleus TaxID=44471 RepID=A0ABX2D2T6_9CYAN|nr:hypothetical protein [Microcoleus asticus IPMA8]